MDKKLLFLDCDPGVDDAVAILLALADPEAQVLGIGAVGGNVPLERTLRNALDLAAFAGRPDLPVYPGAAAPLSCPAIDAADFHGEDGLGGIKLPRAWPPPGRRWPGTPSTGWPGPTPAASPPWSPAPAPTWPSP